VKFVFAGSPDFAAWTLRDLVEVGRSPSLVISQPDRPVGRGRRAASPPAAVVARRLGLDLIQPADINAPEVIETLRASGAEVLVVSAFGQILQKELLDSILCINVHGSLLPAYRGAAPIERALAAGEPCIGVSVMRVEQALDSGPWALQTSLSVSLWDDAGSIGRALAFLGARGIDQVLTGIADGTAVWTEQEGSTTVYAEKLCAEDCLLDLGRPARVVHDQVRSLSPRVGVRVSSGGFPFKVWRTWPYGQPGLAPVPPEAAVVAGRPGALAALKTRLFAGCAEGAVELLSIQPDGKSQMTAAEFLRGYRAKLGPEMTAPTAGCEPAAPAE
jgi:methionyl-tRNA formyltransferase